ncbi:hypothetical protein BGZ95_009269 [Linnemannia exigua]|uniref:Uncharacterized protein n=1 Tax=Linnemannia exigua TaxID=604196 RepID=A0AAD4H6V4_9FUNG|nr:hypothetical protein BGZ95_009269 [Linnemannia exigua]
MCSIAKEGGVAGGGSGADPDVSIPEGSIKFRTPQRCADYEEALTKLENVGMLLDVKLLIDEMETQGAAYRNMRTDERTTSTSSTSGGRQIPIPTEIVLVFGELLDGPSLYACLQVTIGRYQWYHPSFPITSWMNFTAPFRNEAEEKMAAHLLSCFRQTQLVDWYDVRSIHHGGWKGTDFPPLYESELHLSKLMFVLRSMPNLCRLALICTLDHFYHKNALAILTVLNLPRLQYLRLHLAYNMTPTAIETLYPCFSRLKELSLRGDWYRDVDTQGQKYPTFAPWRLQRLTIDHVQISFLWHCPSLEKMTFKHPIVIWNRREPYRENMLKQLLDMRHLKTIVITGVGLGYATEYKTLEPMGVDAVWTKKILKGTDLRRRRMKKYETSKPPLIKTLRFATLRLMWCPMSKNY